MNGVSVRVDFPLRACCIEFLREREHCVGRCKRIVEAVESENPRRDRLLRTEIRWREEPMKRCHAHDARQRGSRTVERAESSEAESDDNDAATVCAGDPRRCGNCCSKPLSKHRAIRDEGVHQ